MSRQAIQDHAKGQKRDDGYLVARVLRDPNEFDEVFERYADKVYRYALQSTGSRDTADDIVSDTMLEVFLSLERFDAQKGSLTTWVFAIARYRIADERRVRRRILRLIERAKAFSPSPPSDPLEVVLQTEAAQRVHVAMASLPREDRDLLLLKYAAGLTGSEIAETVGTTEGAVRTKLHRIRHRLRDRME